MTETLRLFNTLTRSKEVFEPIDAEAVRLYVCGPTVYDYAHIGNARPVIVFDVLFRLLRHLYGADHVVYARNITDVDDKINARAARDFPGLALNDAIARKSPRRPSASSTTTSPRSAACRRRTSRARPTISTRCGAIIERLVGARRRLCRRGPRAVFARRDGSPPGAPRYGSLARRSLDEMLAGARVDVAPYKRDPMDFVLWKPSKPNEPGWPSPCGVATPGRPGWHIECSAMSMAKLLDAVRRRTRLRRSRARTSSTFTAAASISSSPTTKTRSRSPAAPSARRAWPMCGCTTASCRSKARRCRRASAISSPSMTCCAPTKFGGRTWSGEALRLAMLRTHYRQPIDWTVKALEEAEKTLDRWY